MENVTGITSIAGGRIVHEIVAGMKNLGYRVNMRVLKAEELGVPQERRRVFFIATQLDAPNLVPYADPRTRCRSIYHDMGRHLRLAMPLQRPQRWDTTLRL